MGASQGSIVWVKMKLVCVLYQNKLILCCTAGWSSDVNLARIFEEGYCNVGVRQCVRNKHH